MAAFALDLDVESLPTFDEFALCGPVGLLPCQDASDSMSGDKLSSGIGLLPAPSLDELRLNLVEVNHEEPHHMNSNDESLSRVVQERTNRKICELRVEVIAGEVVLRGVTCAYYYKQLASQAVLQEMPAVSLVNDIEVL